MKRTPCLMERKYSAWGFLPASGTGNIAQSEGWMDSTKCLAVSQERECEKTLASTTRQWHTADLKMNHEPLQETQAEALGMAPTVPDLNNTEGRCTSHSLKYIRTVSDLQKEAENSAQNRKTFSCHEKCLQSVVCVMGCWGGQRFVHNCRRYLYTSQHFIVICKKLSGILYVKRPVMYIFIISIFPCSSKYILSYFILLF